MDEIFFRVQGEMRKMTNFIDYRINLSKIIIYRDQKTLLEEKETIVTEAYKIAARKLRSKK